MTRARQLLLDLALPPRMGRADFLPTAANEAALHAVDHWDGWPDRRMIISGPTGSGRSHLVAIWADDTRAAVLRGESLQLPLRAPAYAIDDADAAAGMPAREEAMFHLLERARSEGAPVLMTSRDTPGTWGVALPDLRSRVLACPVTRLARPDDTLLYMTLVKLGDERQLALDPPTIDFLLARMDRSLAFAGRLIAALDHAVLSRQKRASRTLAAEVLAQLQGR